MVKWLEKVPWHEMANIMILRNAHVCMNGNITSLVFNCMPPTFENWVNKAN